MTDGQKRAFKERSGRDWNGKDLYGCWNTNPGESLSAWHFTFKMEKQTLHVCLSNRMCGERYYAYDEGGNETRGERFDDLAVLDALSRKKEEARG